MLNLSRPERFFILSLLILGLFYTGISYHKKTVSGTEFTVVDIDEKEDLININTARVDLLQRLPGIGPVLAKEILAHREERGPFKDIEGLKDIKGIGDKKFEDVKGMITVNE